MHIPVLKKEVLEYLDPKPNQNFIDCTIGDGGHTVSILKKNAPAGKVLGIELDPVLYRKIKQKCARLSLTKRVALINDSYDNLKEIIKQKNFKNISGILFDLGMSTWHIQKSERGFSFMKNELLDMRYNPQRQRTTAAEIINAWSLQRIENILREYGEERFAKRIAKEIVQARKIKLIETTSQLVEIIKKAVPGHYQRNRIHCATKSFQALRIAVNNELNNLKNVLPQALEALAPQGKIVIISFHSLEDRIVKNFFKEKQKQNKIKILTKKPIRPSQEEVRLNPASRSAKLRATIKL